MPGDFTKSLDKLQKQVTERRFGWGWDFSMKNIGHGRPPLGPTAPKNVMKNTGHGKPPLGPTAPRKVMKNTGHGKPPLGPTAPKKVMKNIGHGMPPLGPTIPMKRPVSRQPLMKLDDMKTKKNDGGLDVGPSAPGKRQRVGHESSTSTSIVSTYGQQLLVYESVYMQQQLGDYEENPSAASTFRQLVSYEKSFSAASTFVQLLGYENSSSPSPQSRARGKLNQPRVNFV